MEDLKNQLHRLPKVSPSNGFVKRSKSRLMQQISIQQNEAWFTRMLRKMGKVIPSEAFVSQARMRLMERITTVKRPAFAWLKLVKSVTASSLVMIIAVTATLFFVEGGQIVSAAEDTYLELLEGTAKVKHADKLIWDEISGRVELNSGDLIRVADESKAVVHFFDDTEVRLAENSSFLISQLAVSPSFSRQGIIETSLNEGSAWVQALNVDDGFSSFTLETHDLRVGALNTTLDITTSLNTPSTIRVFRSDVDVAIINSDTREAIETFSLETDQEMVVGSSVHAITDQDKADVWVQNNLNLDQNHLNALRENGLNNLKIAAGTLPGEMLYPVKQAKQRLKLVFSFDKKDLTDAQIEIANSKLSEAIILLEQGERQKALESLMTYQSIAREVLEGEDNDAVAYKLLTPHQKTLVAALPNSGPIVMVKDALNQTEELIADNPIEREKMRLENSIEHLEDVAYFMQIGDINAAKEALVSHELVVTSILNEVENMSDKEDRKLAYSEILDLRNEELELVAALAMQIDSNPVVDTQFAAMLTNATSATEEEVERVIALITPLMPEVVLSEKEVAHISHIDELVAKVNIYKTYQGQKNQIAKIIKEEGSNAKSIEFLTEFRDSLDGRARDLVNTEILELERTAKLNKHKAMKRKINRAQRLRELSD